MMSLAVNWQLQIKLEIYVVNFGLKDYPCDVFTRYLLFWNVSGCNKIFSKCGHMFHIVSTCFPEL